MNGPPPQIPANRKTHRLAITVLAIVVVVFVSPLALYFVYRRSLALSIQARIDAIHQAGFPATCAELDKWYPQPPAGENAADVYGEAFAHYAMWTNEEARLPVPARAKGRPTFSSPPPPRLKRDLLPVVGSAKLPPRTEPLTPEMQKLVAEYLSDNAESLRLLHQAASMKSCRYPIDLTNGVRTLMPHLGSARQAARLFELESIQYTEEQQPRPAVESVVASLDASRSLNQEPTLISYLVLVACQDITLDSLERILNRMSLTDAQLTKLAAAIQESENQQAFTRAFAGERCMHVDVFQGLRTGKLSLRDIYGSSGNDSFSIRFVIAVYSSTGLLQLDQREYLDVMERYVKATQLLPPESLAAFDTVNDKLEHLTRWRILSRLLLPSLSRLAIKAGRGDAKIRDAQAALAVEGYRLANGNLPNQLSDVVPAFLPAVPSDPFDGKPLRYKTLAKGYMVYSVGDDRVDNGGTEKDSEGDSYVPGTDITFTVER
jgi:hypothetical protein